MSIKIFTYPDPYHLDQLDIWAQIKDAPQFCVSQTMVNGLRSVYPIFKSRNQLSTITHLVNSMYSDWESLDRKMSQVRDVDNAINEMAQELNEGVRKSLLFNAKSFSNCIRLLSELGLCPSDLNGEHIKVDQRYLLDIYSKVHCKQSFAFRHQTDKSSEISAIKEALNTDGGEPLFDGMDFETIVIHGIHQFMPSMLDVIEDLGKHFNVILLFNYQPQYQEIYETWIRIYSLFESPISIEKEGQFRPNSLWADSYQSNMLADFIGKTTNGEPTEKEEALSNLEVTEFENLTEFVNYVAGIYQTALKEANKTKKQPLALMSEQFYAASRKANDILRAYFPEQFGERHFLDYPFGHFFVAVLEMWDPETSTVVVDNFSLIKECFNSGAIHEDHPGELVNTFNKVLPFFEDQRTMDSIIARTRNLWKNVGTQDEVKKAIGYFDVTKNELTNLLKALTELNDIVKLFFEDYANDAQGFRKFYLKVQKFIISKLANPEDLDDEMLPVVKELLEKLESSSFDGSASFTCLKQTMSFYLSQNERAGRSAKWIVRGFEQIDGDILRTGLQDDRIYHFACLSDNEVCCPGDARLPWPLDLDFFGKAAVPLDWKYRIYLQAKIEFKNFYLYALLYGLEFNRAKVKLSYIKTENDKDKDLLFLLKILGAKIKPYKAYGTGAYTPHAVFAPNVSQTKPILNKNSQIKATLCPYRFVSEDLVQGRTIFKERFLIHTYMRVLIVSYALEQLQNQKFSDHVVRKAIDDGFQIYWTKFRLENELEQAELIAAAYKDLKYYANNKQKTFPSFYGNNYLKEELKAKETFLLTKLSDVLKELLTPDQVQSLIEEGHYRVKLGAHCTYCASKGTCLEYRK